MPTSIRGGALAPTKPAPVGPKPQGTLEPPHPMLQAAGFNGGIQHFNDLVAKIDEAHRLAYGTGAPPDVALDVAKSDVQPTDYPKLFSVPKSPIVARAQRALVKQGIDPAAPPKQKSNASLIIADLRNVKTSDELDAFLSPDNKPLLDQVMTNAASKRAFTAEYRKALARINEGAASNPAVARQENVLPVTHNVLNSVVGEGAKATAQIASGLLFGPPTLAIAEGRAIGQSVKRGSLVPLAKTNAHLAEGVVTGVARDVSHPAENPGYLFLDALGLLSGGAGAVTKVAAAGKVFGEEGARAAAGELVRRPVGGTATLNKNGYTEEQLLTENPLLQWAQKALVNVRNERMASRIEDQPAPAGIKFAVTPDKIRDIVDLVLDPIRANFSSENKLGREARARRRIETTIAMTAKRELDAAAGWTQTASTAFQRINKTAGLKGLTVGEQKAIQVLATDDPEPLQAWRDFHENMIALGIGDPAAHRAQLAALTLAEKVLENPRPRFQKALALTREVVAEAQQKKIDELGLRPDTAEKRIIAPGEVIRSGSKLDKETVPDERQNPESFYLPFQSKGKPRRGGSGRLESFSPQAGVGGIPKPDIPPELRHEFTGKSILAGDFRIDATNLAGESYARTVRAATKLNEWKQLHASAKDKPTNLRWERPIRDIRGFPDQLREIVGKALDAELTSEEAEQLHPQDIQDLERFLFPGRLVNGVWKLDEPIDHVKWVDGRLIDHYRPPLPKGFRTTGQILNEPFRDVALFLRPAYILNALGNVGMGIMHQGVFFPPNLIRALFSERLYGDKITRTIDALGGSSRSASYAPVNVGEGIAHTLTSVGRTLSAAWNVVTDKMFRRAAIIHELRRQARVAGLDPHDAATYDRLLFDDQYATHRNEAIRRGNKAMVEFDNLTWAEREFLRHLIFVYPWVSRSAVWSIRTVVEHPVQAAVLDQIGREAEDEFPDVLKRVPEWFKQIGYVPIGFNNDGTPKIVNPSSVNTFSTFSQLLYPLEAGFGGNKYASLSDMFGPGAQFLIHASTGKDQFGNQYPGSQWLGAANEVLLQLPQLRRATAKKSVAPSKLNPSDRETLVKRLNSALKQTVFTPGWLDGYGSLLAGGLSPRGVNPLAAEARYYHDLPLEQRHQLEMQLINRGLNLQAGLLKAKLPGAVKDAVSLSGARQLAYDELKKTLGRNPTPQESVGSDIKVLAAHGRIPEPEVGVLQKNLKTIKNPADLDRFRAGLLDKYAGAKDLQEWDTRVRYVYSFRPEVLGPKLAELKRQGVIGSTVLPKDQETLYEWGRQALKFTDEATARKRRIDATTFRTGADKALAESQFNAWMDQHDRPIRVNGHTLPSPVAVNWANLTPHEQQTHLRSIAKSSWGDLTAFDKKLLGKNVDPQVTEAWSALHQWLSEATAQQPPGSNLPPGTKDFYAKALKQRLQQAGQKQLASRFWNDYVFSNEIAARRLQHETVIRESPNKALWGELLRAASGRFTQMLSAGWGRSGIADYWRREDVPKIKQWLAEHPSFNSEVEQFGPEFLNGLVTR